jgi:acyl-coenzyme A synthetase/AMP-(fatty) acid ligase
MGCYKWYQNRPSRFHKRVWARGLGIWHMAHVGPEWSHGMAYDGTRHTDMTKMGGSWIGVDRQGRRSSKGVDCDILAPGMLIF